VIAPQTAATAAVSELPANVPVVAVEAGPADSIPVVSVDHVAGGRRATEHLLELGHPTVWHLAGPTDWVEAQQRLDGWRRTLEAAGAPIPEPLYGDWSPGSGYELARRLVASDDVTAVFVANDQMALGVLRRLHEAGRRVPSDISVVGFDDIPEAAYFTPPLTTVRQDLDEMGRRSLRLLLQEIETGVRSTTRVSLGPELVVRATTARHLSG
jgi:DNA-binding LacI/PurR family transcriptional regulator